LSVGGMIDSRGDVSSGGIIISRSMNVKEQVGELCALMISVALRQKQTNLSWEQIHLTVAHGTLSKAHTIIPPLQTAHTDLRLASIG